MKKVKNTYKKILSKTFLIFFTFYLVMMTIFTVIHQEGQRKEYNIRISNIVNLLRGEVSQTISNYEYATINEDGAPYNKSKENYITNLSTGMSYIISTSSVKSYVKSALFNEEGECIGKSGNYIKASEGIKYDHDGKNGAWSLYRFIDLDKYMSSNEIIELFQIMRDESELKNHSIRVNGYVEGANIIPKTIKIYEEHWRENEKDSYNYKEYGQYMYINETFLKQYDFNPENVTSLNEIETDNGTCNFQFILKKPINIDDYDLGNIVLDEKTIDRYSKVKDSSRINLLDEVKKDPFKVDIKNGFYKVEEEILIPFMLNDKSYYLALNSLYYPLEISIPQLIPIYIFSFIMTVILAIFLSNGLYGVYKKQQLLEKNRQELTNAIGHELKTPLGIIRVSCDVMKENISKEKHDHYLDIITDEVDNMDKMVIEMLDLSKLELKAYELKKEKFSLNTLVNNILKKDQVIIENRKIKVNFKVDKEYEIEADQGRMKQVISNLLSNAIENTIEMGKIEISLSNEKFTIENEGENIPKEQIPFIWDSFYRGKNSKEKYKRGTGLGLAIVKNILELHNMIFGIENTKNGVEFWFKFNK